MSPTPAYQVVLWDFDGTLADTLSTALEVYNRLAVRHGFRVITDPKSVRDMNMREFLKAYDVPRYRVPFLFKTFLNDLKRPAGDIALNDGIAEAVRALAALGLSQGVVSSNRKNNIESCLSAHKIRVYFQNITGTSRLFGKQTGIRAAMRQMRVTPDEVLYVGDEVRDVDAARAAGVDMAAVTWGLNSRSALVGSEPQYIVDSPDEVSSLLS